MVALGVAAAGGCASPAPDVTAAEGRLTASVVVTADDTLRDTVRFAAPAVARHCGGGPDLLIEGVNAGSGVLLWLRPGDSEPAGAYRYASPTDSAGPRTAVAAVRYVLNDVARGFTVDSGSLEVARGDGRLGVRVRGSGLTLPGGMRVAVAADFEGVPMPRDSVSCEREP